MATSCYLARQTILPPRPSLSLMLRVLCHRGAALLRQWIEDVQRARRPAQARPRPRLPSVQEGRELPVSALLARLGAQEQFCVAETSRQASQSPRRSTAVTMLRSG